MKSRAILMAALLGAASSLHAQQNNNQYFQEQQRIQQQQHHAEQARQGYMQSQQGSAPEPSGRWEERWGALATDNTTGSLGAAVNSPSRAAAESAAIADCHAKGGRTCKIDLSYANQCGAMILGQKNYIMRAGDSIEAAVQDGMSRCNATDSNCRVYYSACSKPQFIPN